tara:strand:+ start:149 stop:286 length:138 start_codon:yes stop_codon:yes gene_type:complete
MAKNTKLLFLLNIFSGTLHALTLTTHNPANFAELTIKLIVKSFKE